MVVLHFGMINLVVVLVEDLVGLVVRISAMMLQRYQNVCKNGEVSNYGILAMIVATPESQGGRFDSWRRAYGCVFRFKLLPVKCNIKVISRDTRPPHAKRLRSIMDHSRSRMMFS